MYLALAGACTWIIREGGGKSKGGAPSGWGREITKEEGGNIMSEQEKRIMETLATVVKGASEQTKDYLLGWVEGAASVVCGPQQAAEKNSA